MAHATGHVKLVERKRGPKFYAKFRSNGHQTTRLIGRAWLKRGRPPEGYFTRAMAEVELHKILDGATAPRARFDITFGEACAEWLRYLEEEKQVAERTLGTNRGAVNARLVPFFGKDTPIGEITTERIDAYRAHSLTVGGARGRPLKRTTVQRDLTNLSGVLVRAFKRSWIDSNPYADAEKVTYVPSGDFNVLSVPELEAVARAAGTEVCAALYRVAGYTGLRLGELRALRWRDVDFVNATLHVRRNLPVHARVEKVPKGKRVRSLPLWDQAARALDGLSRRGYLTRPDDLVFVGETGGHLDYEGVKDDFYASLHRVELGHLREQAEPFTFNDLRHSYGTLAVQIYPVTDVQIYMGHERIETTMRYVHHVPKTDAAAKGTAFIEAQMQTVSPACPELAHSDPTESNSEQLNPA
jgi:integrase